MTQGVPYFRAKPNRVVLDKIKALGAVEDGTAVGFVAVTIVVQADKATSFQHRFKPTLKRTLFALLQTDDIGPCVDDVAQQKAAAVVPSQVVASRVRVQEAMILQKPIAQNIQRHECRRPIDRVCPRLSRRHPLASEFDRDGIGRGTCSSRHLLKPFSSQRCHLVQ